MRGPVQSNLTPITDAPDDVARLISAIEGFAASFGLKPHFTDDDLKKLLSTDEPRVHWPAFYWVDAKKSGFVALVEFPNYVELKSIFVFQEARGQNLASAAVVAVKALAQQLGKEIFALVGDGDGTGESASRRFWQSINFDLKPATLYFREIQGKERSLSQHSEHEIEGRAVFELEDGCWQLDLGLVGEQIEMSSKRYKYLKTEYLSFVSPRNN